MSTMNIVTADPYLMDIRSCMYSITRKYVCRGEKLLNAIPQNFAYALSALIQAGGAGTGTAETTEAVSDDEAPSQDAEEETSESVGSSESGTDDDSDEESVEDNKIDGDANENEES